MYSLSVKKKFEYTFWAFNNFLKNQFEEHCFQNPHYNILKYFVNV